MKSYLLIAVMALSFSSTVFAADGILCDKTGTADPVVLLIRTGPTEFELSIDQMIATSYAEVDSAVMEVKANATQDELDYFNGHNTMINMRLSKDFLNAAVGAESSGVIDITYDDIAEETVTTQLSCRVIQ